jgi:nucleoside-diphosphate-sugar epimerase
LAQVDARVRERPQGLDLPGEDERHDETARRRYVITGCAGFIGSHLAEALLAAGSSVVGIDCFTDYYSRRLKEDNLARLARDKRFSFLKLDLVDDPLVEAFDGADGIFHFAAQPGVRGSFGPSFDIYSRNNIVATQRVLDAAADGGLRVVIASSSSVYGNADMYPTPEDSPLRPLSPYGVTKLAAEQLAQAYAACREADFVALRLFTVYGPGQRPEMAFAQLADAVENGRSFALHGSGQQSRDFTYVEDAARAAVLAMDRAPSGRIYNVGGGTEASLLDVVETCERLSGRTIELVRLPTVRADARRTVADTGRIREEIGWSPLVGLEEGIGRQLAARALAASTGAAGGAGYNRNDRENSG